MPFTCNSIFTSLFVRLFTRFTTPTVSTAIPALSHNNRSDKDMSYFAKNKGFTLIELVVVIVILGIIAVLAAPKFVGLSRDAKIAQLQSLAGEISSQNQLVYSKSALDNIEQLEGCSYQCGGHPNWDVMAGEFFVDVSGTRLYVSLGYPLPPLSSTAGPNYRQAFGLAESDFAFTTVTPHQSATAIVPTQWSDKLSDIRSGSFQCHVEYSSPTSVRSYGVKAYTKDC